MFEVIAVKNGYYGGKVRVPGEKFGIDAVEDFSINWMDTDEAKVLAHVRGKSKEKPAAPVVRDAYTEEVAAAQARADKHKQWLKAKSADAGEDDEDGAIDTRRVNTGGTDGVVGAEVLKPGAKATPAQRKGLAEAATGRKPKSTKDADDTLDAIAGASGSDNDDRSRDVAIDQTASGGSPDWEKPVQADD